MSDFQLNFKEPFLWVIHQVAYWDLIGWLETIESQNLLLGYCAYLIALFGIDFSNCYQFRPHCFLDPLLFAEARHHLCLPLIPNWKLPDLSRLPLLPPFAVLELMARLFHLGCLILVLASTVALKIDLEISNDQTCLWAVVHPESLSLAHQKALLGRVLEQAWLMTLCFYWIVCFYPRFDLDHQELVDCLCAFWARFWQHLAKSYVSRNTNSYSFWVWIADQFF